MKIRYLMALSALLLGASQAQAASVTLGSSYTIDTGLAVTSLSNFTGYSGAFNAHVTNLGGYPQFLALGNILTGYVFNGNTTEDRLTINDLGTQAVHQFTGSDPNAYLKGTFGAPIYNNPGIDIYIFESGGPPAGVGDYSNNQYELVAASLTGANGTWVDPSILGFMYASALGNTGSSKDTFGIYVYGIDLSDLGVALGSSVTSLFFGDTCGLQCSGGANGNNNPDIELIAGIDGAAAPISTTPLPGTLPLFVSGLGAVGALCWRRKRRAAA